MGIPDPFGVGGYPMLGESRYKKPPPASYKKALLAGAKRAARTAAFTVVAMVLPTVFLVWNFAWKTAPPTSVALIGLIAELIILAKLTKALDKGSIFIIRCE